MKTKTIKFQQRLSVWQESEVQVECPDDETDQQTFERLRSSESIHSEIEDWVYTKTFDETEEDIPDLEKGYLRTLDFEGDELGVMSTVDSDTVNDDNDED